MPELSRFYGIVIKVYTDDHPPPHVHATYGEFRAIVDIQRAAITAGWLPLRAQGLVLDWARLHQRELLEAWALAQQSRPVFKIAPLE
jgi:hypothetical protein